MPSSVKDAATRAVQPPRASVPEAKADASTPDTVAEIPSGLYANEVLARNLILFRARRRFSQAELAQRSGLSRNSVSNIERGDVSPTISVVGRLATALETTLPDLFADETVPDVANDDELARLAAAGREGAIDARSLMVAIDEAAGYPSSRYSRAGRPRVAR